MKDTFWLKTTDDTEIYVKRWFNPNQRPKAIVQLAHGMVEHIERYDIFSSNLLEQGIFVYGNDHRGHGQTGLRYDSLGYFASEDGFLKVVDDLFLITSYIKKDYPDTPIFLLGHSMGSFLARIYVQRYSKEIAGVILTGTGYTPLFLTTLGITLARALSQREESALMNHLVFGNYNKRINNPKKTHDWLTRDENVVQKFITDPLCGFTPSASYFHDLLTGIQLMQDNQRNSMIRTDLPMLFVSGTEDPVGNYGKGVWKTMNLYHQLGIDDIMVYFYEEARHEVLNEVNKEEVFDSIYQWIISKLKQMTFQ
ncbi:alpha/beta hydrolase [Oceanobacillus piezotolerans]|uniref:Alpha/beta hydrolase n=1 Tax=Oceanobacillus piezotolerans TaxID=2448030 RepID=A0A498DFA3_9BACI|nr:alpha/beta hydrolase [Oceanobacillus piezotolerans]RLL46601.1 alpha/beta hydrolase [Oceanobacillus piezotolerans]